MMGNTVKEKIEQKKKEIAELEKQANQEAIAPYFPLIGKFFRLASTCCIRIDSIDWIDYYVHVVGFLCYSSEEEFRLELKGSECFDPSCSLHEITESDFDYFIESGYNKITKE
jgi:hypothetical protein